MRFRWDCTGTQLTAFNISVSGDRNPQCTGFNRGLGVQICKWIWGLVSPRLGHNGDAEPFQECHLGPPPNRTRVIKLTGLQG